jgi:hypothetical protein
MFSAAKNIVVSCLYFLWRLYESVLHNYTINVLFLVYVNQINAATVFNPGSGGPSSSIGSLLGAGLGMYLGYSQKQQEQKDREKLQQLEQEKQKKQQINIIKLLETMGVPLEQAETVAQVEPNSRRDLVSALIIQCQKNDDMVQSLLIDIERNKDQQVESLQGLYLNSVLTEQKVQEIYANIQNSPAKQLAIWLPLHVAYLSYITISPHNKEKAIKALQYEKEKLEDKQQRINETQKLFIEDTNKRAYMAKNRLNLLQNMEELLKKLNWQDIIWECLKSFIVFLVICAAFIRIGYLVNASSLGVNTGLVLGLILTWFVFESGASALQSNEFSRLDRLRIYLENDIGIEDQYSIILPRMVQFIELPTYAKQLQEVNQNELLKKQIKDEIIMFNYNACPINLDCFVNKYMIEAQAESIAY